MGFREPRGSLHHPMAGGSWISIHCLFQTLQRISQTELGHSQDTHSLLQTHFWDTTAAGSLQEALGRTAGSGNEDHRKQQTHHTHPGASGDSHCSRAGKHCWEHWVGSNRFFPSPLAGRDSELTQTSQQSREEGKGHTGLFRPLKFPGWDKSPPESSSCAC